MKIIDGKITAELNFNPVTGMVDIILRSPGPLEEYRSISAKKFIELLIDFPIEESC